MRFRFRGFRAEVFTSWRLSVGVGWPASVLELCRHRRTEDPTAAPRPAAPRAVQLDFHRAEQKGGPGGARDFRLSGSSWASTLVEMWMSVQSLGLASDAQSLNASSSSLEAEEREDATNDADSIPSQASRKSLFLDLKLKRDASLTSKSGRHVKCSDLRQK